jgi:hypothetical protein
MALDRRGFYQVVETWRFGHIFRAMPRRDNSSYERIPNSRSMRKLTQIAANVKFSELLQTGTDLVSVRGLKYRDHPLKMKRWLVHLFIAP